MAESDPARGDYIFTASDRSALARFLESQLPSVGRANAHSPDPKEVQKAVARASYRLAEAQMEDIVRPAFLRRVRWQAVRVLVTATLAVGAGVIFGNELRQYARSQTPHRQS